MSSKLIFKIRCSAISKITAGNIGLTENQESRLQELQTRNIESAQGVKGVKPLTDKMHSELIELISKKANPDLPESLKTYCKQWLKEQLYNRREQVKSKYIDKGNNTEEIGFTNMAVQLNLGMVYKNEEFKENDFLIGTCDLDHKENDTVYDNKSSWGLSQFPMFESVIPNKDYEEQIQGYCELWNRGNGSVVYTLNDMPIEMLRNMLGKHWLSDDERQDEAINLVYTLEYWNEVKSELFPNARDIKFIEIPLEKRVKEFKFKRDPDFIEKVKERVKLCQKYVDYLQTL